jgi:hypothetical protein
MKQLLRGIVAVSIALIPSIVRADQISARVEAARVMLPSGLLATSLASLDARQQPSSSRRGTRDSLKNGALIGAIVGAAALGGFGLFLCHALDDTGDPDCFPGVLGIAGLGAGIGAGAGVAIDALLVRQAAPAVRVHIRF